MVAPAALQALTNLRKTKHPHLPALRLWGSLFLKRDLCLQEGVTNQMPVGEPGVFEISLFSLACPAGVWLRPCAIRALQITKTEEHFALAHGALDESPSSPALALALGLRALPSTHAM